VGSASRLQEESEAYKARIVAQAEGDAQRFRSVLTEYQKAPQVTRDRMYLDTMQQIYTNVTKVLVDSKQGSNLLYMPIDKIMQMSGQAAVGAANSSTTADPLASNSVVPVAPAIVSNDARTRDNSRSRDRDVR
jgi:membrane protease subunit HflK